MQYCRMRMDIDKKPALPSKLQLFRASSMIKHAQRRIYFLFSQDCASSGLVDQVFYAKSVFRSEPNFLERLVVIRFSIRDTSEGNIGNLNFDLYFLYYTKEGKFRTKYRLSETFVRRTSLVCGVAGHQMSCDDFSNFSV